MSVQRLGLPAGPREIQQRMVEYHFFMRSERHSLLTQISDLALRVFIPLGRLFSPIDSPSVRLPLPSMLLESAEDPLHYFVRSDDLNHLDSILRVVENGRFQIDGARALPTLCRYFEALSVYKGSLTDLHWNFEEDKLSLTVWSMLGYYSHARDKFSGEYPDLIAAIDASLVRALTTAVPILRMISECTEIRENLQYLAFKKIEMQIRKLYDLRIEAQMQETGSRDLWGMSSILNFDECRELSEIKAKSFLSQREKVEQASQVWEELSAEDPLREQVLASEELRAIDDKMAQLASELTRKTERVERMTLRADLTEVKKMIQGLYELEQLEVVSRVSDALLRRPASREAHVQWLILLREGFRVVLSNQSLNTSIAQSIPRFSGLIRTIRDYYEHPEDYVLQLDSGSLMDREAQVSGLERQLFQELKKMGAEIKQRIDLRAKKIRQVLRPHAQKATQDILRALVFRDQEQTEMPRDVREFTAETYPLCFAFAARIVHKRDLHSAANEAKVEEKGAVPDRNRPLHVPFPHQIKPKEVAQRLEGILIALHGNVTRLSRANLERRLEQDLPFRLMIQREICHSCRLLEQFTHRTRNMLFEHRDEKLFEKLYQAVRNTRNFQTHDLWRKDIKGLVNTAYLLVYDLLNLFSNLRAGVVPFEEDSPQHQLFQSVIRGHMTQESLEKAIFRGFNVNCYDYKGRSLLHFLADSPTDINLQLARVLIENGARVYHADNQQMRPLHYAAQSGFLPLARLFVDAGSVTDADSQVGTPVELAQSHEHPELARYLSLSAGAQRSSNTRALLDAVENLDLGKVQRLIGREFDPRADFQGRLPLVALFDRREENFRTQIAIARVLVAAGADINQQSPETGETALHVAASQSDHPEVIRYLMSLNPDLSIQDFRGKTPLHHAVAATRENWVNILLAVGSPVDVRDNSGNTPLLIVSNRLGPSHFPIRPSSPVERKRADSEDEDSDDEKVFRISIPRSSFVFNPERPAHRVMRALLTHGANVEAENRYGTVLHHLAERSGVEEISAVIERGASPFRLGQGGLYFHSMPHQLSRNEEVIGYLFRQMEFLFSHLTTEDQRSLTFRTGDERSPFISWIREEAPSSDQERRFLGQLYQRRFLGF